MKKEFANVKRVLATPDLKAGSKRARETVGMSKCIKTGEKVLRNEEENMKLAGRPPRPGSLFYLEWV